MGAANKKRQMPATAEAIAAASVTEQKASLNAVEHDKQE